MHFTTAALGLLSLSSVALAGTLRVTNKCQNQVYLTVTRQDQSHAQHVLKKGITFAEPIANKGNSYGLTNNPDYYSPNTPKLIWGVSDDTSSHLVYWSVAAKDGNLGKKFLIKDADASCASTSDTDGKVHACPDSKDITLTLCP